MNVSCGNALDNPRSEVSWFLSNDEGTLEISEGHISLFVHILLSDILTYSITQILCKNKCIA